MCGKLFRSIPHQLMGRHIAQGNRNIRFLSDVVFAAPFHQFQIRSDIIPQKCFDHRKLVRPGVDRLQKRNIFFTDAQNLCYGFALAVEHAVVIETSPARIAVSNIGCETIEFQLYQILQHRIA